MNSIVVEDIQGMRLRQGIHDVELREEIRGLVQQITKAQQALDEYLRTMKLSLASEDCHRGHRDHSEGMKDEE